MSDKKTTEKGNPRDLVGSIAHGLNVIRAFDAEDPQMTLSQVAEKTGMTRAGARRYLLTLVHLGYVSQDDRLFRLAPKILELGYAYLATVPLSSVAQPYLQRIRDKTGEATALAVLDNDYVVHIARAPTQKILAPTITIGRRFKAVYTSTGRVMIAMKGDKTIDKILKETELTKVTRWSITTKEELKKELQLIKQHQYSVVDQEIEEGARSLAVPVFNNQNEAIAAINIVTNVAAVPKKQLIEEFLPILKETAQELQMALVAK